jgi:hypothetical protein
MGRSEHLLQATLKKIIFSFFVVLITINMTDSCKSRNPDTSRPLRERVRERGD